MVSEYFVMHIEPVMPLNFESKDYRC